MNTTNVTLTDPQNPAGGRIRWAVIPALSTVFGFIVGQTIHQPLGMAGFGLLWGIAAAAAAPRVARAGARSVTQANAPIYIMLPMACIVLGGSLIGHLAGPTPTSFLSLVQQPGYTLFFYAFHGPFEWLLMPWALMANWRGPNRRRLLLVAATLFYGGRIASALYFAPAALDWGQHPEKALANLDQVESWIRLDLVRVVIQDICTAALMLAAALHPRFRLVSAAPEEDYPAESARMASML